MILPEYANSSHLHPHPSFSSSPTQGKGTSTGLITMGHYLQQLITVEIALDIDKKWPCALVPSVLKWEQYYQMSDLCPGITVSECLKPI